MLALIFALHNLNATINQRDHIELFYFLSSDGYLIDQESNQNTIEGHISWRFTSSPRVSYIKK